VDCEITFGKTIQMHVLYLFLFSFLLFGESIQNAQTDLSESKILFVVSNADVYGDSDIPTSNHFSEIVIPYDILSESGYEIDFLSPNGGAVPIGYINTTEPLIKRYLYDCEFMKKLKTTSAPTDINPDEYKAIYYSGGGASMFGIVDNEAIQNIAMTIYEKNQGMVSAVCHGSLGISNLKTSEGKYLVTGRDINGFPDQFENKEAKYFKEFDNSVEALLRLRGANFSYSEEGWDGYFIKDDRIITGQDPSSAASVAKSILRKWSQSIWSIKVETNRSSSGRSVQRLDRRN